MITWFDSPTRSLSQATPLCEYVHLAYYLVTCPFTASSVIDTSPGSQAQPVFLCAVLCSVVQANSFILRHVRSFTAQADRHSNSLLILICLRQSRLSASDRDADDTQLMFGNRLLTAPLPPLANSICLDLSGAFGVWFWKNDPNLLLHKFCKYSAGAFDKFPAVSFSINFNILVVVAMSMAKLSGR